jgi:hypothetical protein
LRHRYAERTVQLRQDRIVHRLIHDVVADFRQGIQSGAPRS